MNGVQIAITGILVFVVSGIAIEAVIRKVGAPRNTKLAIVAALIVSAIVTALLFATVIPNRF